MERVIDSQIMNFKNEILIVLYVSFQNMERKIQVGRQNRKILSIKVGDISQVNLECASMLSNDATCNKHKKYYYMIILIMSMVFEHFPFYFTIFFYKLSFSRSAFYPGFIDTITFQIWNHLFL